RAFYLYENIGKELESERHSSDPVAKNVLIASIRGSVPLATAFEGILGTALRLREARVSSLVCNSALKRCDGYLLENMTENRCRRCAKTAAQYMDGFGLRTLALGRFIGDGDRKEAAALVRSCAPQAL